MTQYRLSGPARADISSILRESDRRHGQEARGPYPYQVNSTESVTTESTVETTVAAEVRST